MNKSKSLLADLKVLTRDPIMILLFAMPLFMFLLMKAILYIAVPFAYTKWNVNIYNYSSYILALLFIMIPGMLGTVMAFLMIDDRDSKIYELLCVTPIGYEGYIFNRMILPVIFSIVYILLGYFIIDLYSLNLLALMTLFLLLPIESISIGMLLFILSEDKVKGLTYSKGLSLLYMTSLVQLLKHPIITFFSSFLPFYWIWRIIDKSTIQNMIIGLLIHILWLFIAYELMNKKIRRYT